jgi:hypothetical protein
MSTAHALVPDAPGAAAPVLPPDGRAPAARTTPLAPVAEALGHLPPDWAQVRDVAVGDDHIDLVVLGPNGLFAVHLDPDPRPAAVRPGTGLFRAGARNPDPVKRALRNTDALRRRLARLPGDHFPYPVLVTSIPGETGRRLGRLLVVRPGRLAEVIWSHVSRPLRRSERASIASLLDLR